MTRVHKAYIETSEYSCVSLFEVQSCVRGYHIRIPECVDSTCRSSKPS